MKQVGILGLPQSGKTTLFEVLLRGAGAHAAHAGREQMGVVRVPDRRLDRLSALFPQKKTVHAQVQFVDSGAARGVHEAQGGRAAKGPDLFSAVRNCDAFVAVVRDFADPALPVAGGVDPARDLRTLETELILNDLGIVESRREKLSRDLKLGRKEGEHEHAVLGRVCGALEAERPLRGERLDAEEQKLLKGFQLLSQKPLLVVYNQDEASTRATGAPGPGALVLALKVRLEHEIVSLPPEERPAFRAELGLPEEGLSLVIRACYELLGLITFFTVGSDEIRAWTLHRGQKAVEAAGEVHTDMAKGFIRAEVITWEHLVEAGGHHAKAREKGWLRLEGRDYVVQDGDCLEIRFGR